MNRIQQKDQQKDIVGYYIFKNLLVNHIAIISLNIDIFFNFYSTI